MDETGSSETVLRLTAQIVAAHVEHNTVQAEALPGLIEKVYQTLRDVGQAPVKPAKPVPAVSVKQSVKPDCIICLEDGKKLKMLKRHLMTAYKMTPAQYRQRWGLPRIIRWSRPAMPRCVHRWRRRSVSAASRRRHKRARQRNGVVPKQRSVASGPVAARQGPNHERYPYQADPVEGSPESRAISRPGRFGADPASWSVAAQQSGG